MQWTTKSFFKNCKCQIGNFYFWEIGRFALFFFLLFKRQDQMHPVQICTKSDRQLLLFKCQDQMHPPEFLD